jgi:hypothetical protein
MFSAHGPQSRSVLYIVLYTYTRSSDKPESINCNNPLKNAQAPDLGWYCFNPRPLGLVQHSFGLMQAHYQPSPLSPPTSLLPHKNGHRNNPNPRQDDVASGWYTSSLGLVHLPYHCFCIPSLWLAQLPSSLFPTHVELLTTPHTRTVPGLFALFCVIVGVPRHYQVIHGQLREPGDHNVYLCTIYICIYIYIYILQI